VSRPRYTRRTHASSQWWLFGGAAPGELHRLGADDALDGAEHDVVAFGVDNDGFARVEFLPQDLLGQRVLDEALDRTAQRPGAERGVVTLLRQHELGVVGELEAEALRVELVAESLDQQVDDLGDLLG